MKKENYLLNIDSSKMNKTTLYIGTLIKYLRTKIALINIIEFNRKLLIPIITWSQLL